MHPLFARPVAYKTFNRGMLLNVSLRESNKDNENKWKCHTYHDVDMISEDDRTLYYCPENPTHMSNRISDRQSRPKFI
jgi:hypothetical protein